jgi:hypothetical protein
LVPFNPNLHLLQEYSQVIFYGAGKLCRNLISRLGRLRNNIFKPNAIWDSDAENKQPISGLSVMSPCFESLTTGDLVVVTITDEDAVNEVIEAAHSKGFYNIYGYKGLYQALKNT